MHRLHDPILIVGAGPLDRHAPHGRVVPPAPNDISVEPAIRMGQLDVPLAHALRPPPAVTGARDPLLALAADVAVVIEGRAATRVEALVGGAEVEAVRGVGAVAGLEGAEAEDAGDEGPEVGDVGDDDGGGGLAGVPVEVDEGAVARGEVVVAVEDGAEDDEGAEGEDGEEDEFPGGRVSHWEGVGRVVTADLLMGSCALSNNGTGRARINRSDVMFHTASLIRWL